MNIYGNDKTIGYYNYNYDIVIREKHIILLHTGYYTVESLTPFVYKKVVAIQECPLYRELTLIIASPCYGSIVRFVGCPS